ncbi:MAG: hypothetical protein IKQ72_05815 [Bacteroidaceae bacterium]|nr:hypothetical protein [Bacteroidaceae bacterium]
MTKDKALEELFLAQKPQFDDKADFMANLNKRLDAVEFIKQHQEASVRRYKMAMAAAFLVGIMSGAVAMFFVLSTPVNVPLFTFGIQASWMLWIADNSRLITAVVLALFLSFGIVSIINNVQEIIRMRTSIKDKSATHIPWALEAYR